jgi:hypothetical protein
MSAQVFDDIYSTLSSVYSDENPWQIENKIMSLMQIINDDAELFWEVLSWNKDILSYKFSHRLFPVIGCDGFNLKIKEDVTDDAKKKKGKPAFKPVGVFKKSRAEMVQELKGKYDVRTSIRKSLTVDYVDEADTGKVKGQQYRPLELSDYYPVQEDMLRYIFETCIKLGFNTSTVGIWCSMIVNPKTCHLVLKNSILNMVMNLPVFQDPEYREIILHCLFYGFYICYKEECIVKACATVSHRFVLNLQAACKLPIYNGPLESNPYIPLTLSNDMINANDVQDIRMKPFRSDNNDRGVYSLWSFKERFRIFTNGLFDDMSFDKISFGGSVISACVIRNPLEKLFYDLLPISKDAIFATYMDPGNSENPGDPEYLDTNMQLEKLSAEWKRREIGLRNYFNEYYPSKEVLKFNNLEAEESLSDIDIMVDTVQDDAFNQRTYEIFKHIRSKLTLQLGTKPTEDQLQLIKITTKKSYKYYVTGTAIKRNLEIFRLYGSPHIGGVSRFHFPAVRGIYDGTNVYVLPSLVSFAMTGYFIDYKWMSCAQDTKNLILKYYIRGGLCILNNKEHELIKEYINDNECWKILNKQTREKQISINDPIFKPRLSHHGIYSGLDTIPFYDYRFVPEYIPNQDNQSGNSRFGFNLNIRFPAGYIQPLCFWKLNAYLCSLKRSEKYNKPVDVELPTGPPLVNDIDELP